MDHERIIDRLNSLEAAANLIASECRRTKKELAGELKPRKLVRGEMSEEEVARFMVKRMQIKVK